MQFAAGKIPGGIVSQHIMEQRIMNKIPARLKQVKEKKGLTTSEISRLLGIHAPTWCKYESGKSLMSLETLHRFCKTLDVSADWLLGLTEEKE